MKNTKVGNMLTGEHKTEILKFTAKLGTLGNLKNMSVMENMKNMEEKVFFEEQAIDEKTGKKINFHLNESL